MAHIRKSESIAVIGGGIMGLAIAHELAKNQFSEVTIFEKERQLGGLCLYYLWQNITCDRFYHVITPKDKDLIRFINELNLDSEVFWRETKSGFYGDGKLVPFSSIKDFFKFPFLSLWQKFRLGLGIVHVTQIKKPEGLDRIYARDWLTNIFGISIYRNIWEPLLRSKLGSALDRTSAAFIWATIVRLYNIRSPISKTENMGYVRGGCHKIVELARSQLAESHVKIYASCPVQKVDLSKNHNRILLVANGKSYYFDRIIFTVPCPEVLKILDNPDHLNYWIRLRNVEYLGILCVLLILNHWLSPYYVINLLDKSLPFTGIIESSNLIPLAETDGKYLVYLPKYVTTHDPLNILSDSKIVDIFVRQLKIVFTDLRDEDILHKKVFREKYVQPIHELKYSDRRISIKTPLKNVYIANNSSISDSTVNNNAAIAYARRAVDEILEDT